MLEICVESRLGAIVAYEANADRIELSERLDLGGVTPNPQLTEVVLRDVPLPLIVLIRCRPGHFVYDESEKERMLQECEIADHLGVHGVAIGSLTPDNQLDLTFLRSVRSKMPNCQLVMHRAFDQVQNPAHALEQLVDLGFDRILTSGGPPTAIEGLAQLRSLQEQSRGRIEILPAGGVNPANAKQILDATGVYQLHGSLRKQTDSTSNPWLPYAPWVSEIRGLMD